MLRSVQEGLPKAQAEGGPACPVLVCGTPKANQQARSTAAQPAMPKPPSLR